MHNGLWRGQNPLNALKAHCNNRQQDPISGKVGSIACMRQPRAPGLYGVHHISDASRLLTACSAYPDSLQEYIGGMNFAAVRWRWGWVPHTHCHRRRPSAAPLIPLCSIPACGAVSKRSHHQLLCSSASDFRISARYGVMVLTLSACAIDRFIHLDE